MPKPTPTPAPEPGADPTQIGPVAILKRWVRPLMLLVALGFMLKAGHQLVTRWDGDELCHDPIFLCLSLLPLLLASFVQGRGWLLLVAHLTGKSVPPGPGLLLYLESQLARYTPGKVGLPVVRMAGAERLGVSARLVGGSILLEVLSWVVTGAMLGGAGVWLMVPELGGALGSIQRLTLVLVFACAMALMLLVLVGRQHMPRVVCRVLSVEGRGALVPWTLPGLHLVYWLLWLGHGYLVTRGLCAGAGPALAGSSYFVLAPVLGFVALVAPAGVGVREAFLSLALAGSLGVAPALAAGIASRLASLAADLCTWGICRLLQAGRGWR